MTNDPYDCYVVDGIPKPFMTHRSNILWVPTEVFISGKDWYYMPAYKPVIEQHVKDITVTNFSLLMKYLSTFTALIHFCIIIGDLSILFNDKKYE